MNHHVGALDEQMKSFWRNEGHIAFQQILE